jgi:4-hydroxy-tetrahydrodipicolinate synthase
MPLLHLDTSIKFVQYIKLAEAMTGLGPETVRAPRLRLTGDERKEIESVISLALRTRTDLSKL